MGKTRMKNGEDMSPIISDAIITINHVQEHLDNLMEGLMESTVGAVEWQYGDERLDSAFMEGRAYGESDCYSEFVLLQFRDMKAALELMIDIETNDSASDVCKSWIVKVLETLEDGYSDVSYLCKMHKGN